MATPVKIIDSVVIAVVSLVVSGGHMVEAHHLDITTNAGHFTNNILTQLRHHCFEILFPLHVKLSNEYIIIHLIWTEIPRCENLYTTLQNRHLMQRGSMPGSLTRSSKHMK
jgi:hypothetical protein